MFRTLTIAALALLASTGPAFAMGAKVTQAQAAARESLNTRFTALVATHEALDKRVKASGKATAEHAVLTAIRGDAYVARMAGDLPAYDAAEARFNAQVRVVEAALR